MSKYIEYDAIDYRNDKMHDKSSDFIDGVIYMAQRIEDAPSIDIVFCKECRHSFINENHPQKPRICGLTRMCGTTKDDWYCADGER